jgi:hypothetical protein
MASETADAMSIVHVVPIKAVNEQADLMLCLQACNNIPVGRVFQLVPGRAESAPPRTFHTFALDVRRRVQVAFEPGSMPLQAARVRWIDARRQSVEHVRPPCCARIHLHRR